MGLRALLFPTLPIPIVLIAHQALSAECAPSEAPGKHGKPNVYRLALDGDRHGNDISQSIWVTFRMFDDGRIEALLKYDNAKDEPLCAGVHIRLDDIHHRTLADFYSNPYRCIGHPAAVEGAGTSASELYELNLTTTASVVCNYAHLYIEPNYSHPQTVNP